MILRFALALLLAGSCPAAIAQESAQPLPDAPLSLSYTASLNSQRAAGETPPEAPAASTGQALPVVELTAPPQAGEAIDLTMPPDDLYERLRTGFSMPNLNSDLVLHHQQWYMNRPDYLRRIVERSARYMHHIVEEIERRGMPSELALLPMVESAYNPMAYSRAHASGLWQFIPSTGKNFKLEQNWWVDERRDIVASTSAALDYLQTIYEMHGDWHLALASYNWGEGAVGRAIAKNRARGLASDYPSLTMPGETRNYVPKLQALKNIFNNPKIMADLGLASLPNRAYFGTVAQAVNIDVKVAARLAEMPVADFVALNPAHNRPVIRAETPLVIPAEKLDAFASNLESHQNSDQPLSSWQSYTLRSGDKLEQLAPRFGMTLANLKAINGIKGKIRITPGFTLLVPARERGETVDLAALPEQPRLPNADPAPVATARSHTVRRGETLPGIARRYGTTGAELKRINSLRGDQVKAGMKLALAAPEKYRAASAGTPADASNKSGKTTFAERKAASQAKTAPRPARYTVRRGDTLAGIARRFNVGQADLQRWNNIPAGVLQPGKTLTIQRANNG